MGGLRVRGQRTKTWAARAAPSVCPRRRARYLRLRCYYDMLPQRAGGTVRAVYAFLASACAVGLQDILTPPDLSLHKTVPTVFYSFSLSDKLDDHSSSIFIWKIKMT